MENGTIQIPDRHPLDNWTYHAHRRAQLLQLPVDFIEEAREIVVGALGPTWVEDQLQRGSPSIIGLVKPPHPVIHDIRVAGDCQIVGVFELAVYLKRLVTVPGFHATVAMLRSRDQFATTLMQLAYAYRFKKAGIDVSLEPDTDEGRKGDIGLRVSGNPILAECYVPEFEEKEGVLLEVVEYSTKKIAMAAKARGIIARIRLRLLRVPTPDERRQIERISVELLNTVAPGGEEKQVKDFVEISVEDITKAEMDPDWPDLGDDEPSGPDLADWVLSEKTWVTKGVDAVKDGTATPVSRGSRILIHRPPRTLLSIQERVAELESRFSPKLTQVRSSDSGRMLIACVREAGGMNDRDLEVARLLGQRLVTKHERIGEVILTSRVWTTKNRFRFQGIVLHGVKEARLPQDVFNTITRIDHKEDLIQDWR